MKRMRWHLFGAVASFVFAVGSASLAAGNTEIELAPWCWTLVTVIGFVGALRYGAWYQEERKRGRS
jgi:hypothetical protein